MGSRYNETKLLVLLRLEGGSEKLASEIASELGKSHESIAMALLRYKQWRLVNRHRIGGAYLYSITEKGLERLYWLEDQYFIND